MRALRVLQHRADAIRDRVSAAVACELGETGDLVAAAKRAHRGLDAEGARALARAPARAPACASGCSFCCHVHVEATRAEVLAIAEHLVSTRSGLASFVESLAAHVRVVSAMDHEARWAARIPCALLSERGTCSVYEVRPLRCRAFHSCSRDTCREAFEGTNEPAPDTSSDLARAFDAAEQGFERALEERGVSTEPVLLERELFEILRLTPRA